MYAQASRPGRVEPIEQLTEDGFRRTYLRRTPAEVAQARRRLGQDVADMAREDLDVYPEPSDDKCPPCPYLDPCLALRESRDDEPILRTGYRRRAAESPEEGRLGGRAWGMGRGAAPPKFPGRRDGAHGGSLGQRSGAVVELAVQWALDDAGPQMAALVCRAI